MIFLLDANVLIRSKNTYYKLDQVPEYWEWLVHQSKIGIIKINYECYEELVKGGDELAEWAKQNENCLVYKREVSNERKMWVLYEGYAKDFSYKLGEGEAENLTEEEIERIGKDHFMIAHAYEGKCTVVTAEITAPKKKRNNKKIPDVCKKLGVSCMTQFQMNDRLNFKTSWKTEQASHKHNVKTPLQYSLIES